MPTEKELKAAAAQRRAKEYAAAEAAMESISERFKGRELSTTTVWNCLRNLDFWYLNGTESATRTIRWQIKELRSMLDEYERAADIAQELGR